MNLIHKKILYGIAILPVLCNAMQNERELDVDRKSDECTLKNSDFCTMSSAFNLPVLSSSELSPQAVLAPLFMFSNEAHSGECSKRYLVMLKKILKKLVPLKTLAASHEQILWKDLEEKLAIYNELTQDVHDESAKLTKPRADILEKERKLHDDYYCDDNDRIIIKSSKLIHRLKEEFACFADLECHLVQDKIIRDARGRTESRIKEFMAVFSSEWRKHYTTFCQDILNDGTSILPLLNKKFSSVSSYHKLIGRIINFYEETTLFLNELLYGIDDEDTSEYFDENDETNEELGNEISLSAAQKVLEEWLSRCQAMMRAFIDLQWSKVVEPVINESLHRDEEVCNALRLTLGDIESVRLIFQHIEKEHELALQSNEIVALRDLIATAVPEKVKNSDINDGISKLLTDGEMRFSLLHDAMVEHCRKISFDLIPCCAPLGSQGFSFRNCKNYSRSNLSNLIVLFEEFKNGFGEGARSRCCYEMRHTILEVLYLMAKTSGDDSQVRHESALRNFEAKQRRYEGRRNNVQEVSAAQLAAASPISPVFQIPTVASNVCPVMKNNDSEINAAIKSINGILMRKTLGSVSEEVKRLSSILREATIGSEMMGKVKNLRNVLTRGRYNTEVLDGILGALPK